MRTARWKILSLPLVPATVFAAVPTSAPSLGKRLEAAPATVTSATAAAPAVAWAGCQPSRPRSPWSLVRQTPKSMTSPVVDLAQMKDGQSAIGLLTSCAGGHHNMPRPCKLTFWPWKRCPSHVTWATSMPILVFLGLSVLDLGPVYVTDRQTYVGQRQTGIII